MWASTIVVIDIPGNPIEKFRHCTKIVVKDVVIFDSPPKSFNEYIIQSTTFTVHTDTNIFIQQYASKLSTCELAALICVEYFWLAKIC